MTRMRWLRQVPRIALHRGQRVLGQDARRDRPGRVQNHVGDLGLEHGRLAVRAPDHDLRRPDWFVVAEIRDVETRHVDQHELALDLVQDPAAALEVDAQLIDARPDGHVHRGARRSTHCAVRCHAVPRLEVLHRQLERGIEEFRLRDACDTEIARDFEPPAQDRHTRVGHARLERRAVGQLRPAAVRRNAAVLAQLFTPAAIPHVLGSYLDEGLDDAAAVERPDKEFPRVWCAQRPRRIVPLRAQLDRVNLAAVQVKEGERHRVGREELEIGLLGGGSPAADRNSVRSA